MATVVVNEAAVRLLLDSPAGPVGRDLLRRAENIENAAKENARAFFYQRTGNLVQSIEKDVGVDAIGLRAIIGCNKNIAPYAGYLEQGTQPHEIVGNEWLVSAPDHPDPLLAPQRSVNHPGNPAIPFIRPALEAGRL